ncbi:DUF177 domain-containing protein [Salibacter sp.]|uniref:YceD family protein n=1 Tax=Salibacter sp. TaxID=2010995 RepID=UPI0028708BE3|nr:DUF177 domain-containing protein [Salibacter sp.]MDR9398794.1 DUF177 domain-containing protein [Salibacter sp.]MDR9487866.1 DUF177 domain-containing protein [Salibacter sp.]
MEKRQMLKEFEIHFAGLKVGEHNFDFQIDKLFFDCIEYSDIDDGEFTVSLKMQKEANMLLLDFKIDGGLISTCDRCLDPVRYPVELEEQLIVKFSDEDEQPDDEHLYLVPTDEHTINVSQMIYELIRVQVPLTVTHEEGECNEKMIEELEKAKPQKEDDVDPRWNKLKELINKENK